MQVMKYSIFADYFQFYLMDELEMDDTSEIWTDKAFEMKLAIATHTLAIGTLRNVDVEVIVEVHGSQPNIDSDEWDYISKGHIYLPSGKCIVMGCTDEVEKAERIIVEPGEYSAIAMAKGLDSVTAHWEPANDLYRVIIWPSTDSDYLSIKQYQNT